ncbi:hypothetical protein DFH05DRAFT_1467036 [Lentinula detonsa]|uniref:Uncharacterized protein n=1 Tax=Lentinula detonsa TaxID=2804962 RepID=A0A9W8PAQ3_9AGAR|nr:hypothetical protein DFH05DRAFT_1467036 [Lentinula detonsa]
MTSLCSFGFFFILLARHCLLLFSFRTLEILGGTQCGCNLDMPCFPVTNELSGDSEVALFMRIAFLRWQSCAYPTCVTDKFWDKVDQSLTKTRTDCKTPAELQAVFEAILAQDKAKFGEPDLITHPAVALRDVDQWLLSVNGVAGAAADLTSVSTATSRSF